MSIALAEEVKGWQFSTAKPLQWRHNGHDGVSNHRPHDCLLNCLLKRGSKKTSKLRVTELCAGNSPVTGEFPNGLCTWNSPMIGEFPKQRPVTWKMFPFGDVIMPTEQWRHNGHDGVSNHRPHDCLLNCLLKRGSKKTSKLRVTELCAGNSPVTGEFPNGLCTWNSPMIGEFPKQRPVTWKMFPFGDVIMPTEIHMSLDLELCL